MPTKKSDSESKKLEHYSESLAKANKDLLEQMEKLTHRVDKLVGIFEEASKHVGEVETNEAKINALATKLESLLEQNKVIAKGLIMLEKYVRGKTESEVTRIQPKPKFGGF